MESKDVSK